MGVVKHLITELAFAFMHLPMKGQWRPFFAKMGGVKFSGSRQYIGRGVSFDAMAPDRIHVGDLVHITEGCMILTHYLDTTRDGIHFKIGDVFIGDNTFIGAHSVICKPCRIGSNSIVGAGSVVTKDIPSYSVAVGIPARVIKVYDFNKKDWVKNVN